jgi:hypothetical protein
MAPGRISEYEGQANEPERAEYVPVAVHGRLWKIFEVNKEGPKYLSFGCHLTTASSGPALGR